jgi:hypothetical protein
MRLAAALAVAATALSIGGGSAVYAATAVPWTDTAVTGYIGLCDRNGQPVDSGNLDTTPFVWRAVSSAAARAPYDAPGRTATLYAFQPRQDLAPGEWSGDMLTASTRYSNPVHPMAEATGDDLSLAGFVSEFPPAWDGLLQLRMYLGAPNQPAQALSYAATTIKVSGSTWSVVSGGNVPCSSGRAVSIESILLPNKALAGHSPAPSTPAGSQGTASTPSPTIGPIGQGGADAAGIDHGALDAATTSPSASGSGNLIELVVIALLAALAGGAAVAWRHRRSPGGSS